MNVKSFNLILVLFIAVFVLFGCQQPSDQNVGAGISSNYWKVVSAELTPILNSWRIKATGGLNATGTSQFDSIINYGLSGSGTKCVHADNNGLLSLATADCGTGTGGGGGDSVWVNNLAGLIYQTTTTDDVLIGGTTTTTQDKLEVQGNLAVTGNASTTGNLNIKGNATTTGSQYVGSLNLNGVERNSWPTFSQTGLALGDLSDVATTTSGYGKVLVEQADGTYDNQATSTLAFSWNNLIDQPSLFSGSWDDLTKKAATSTILALLDSNYRIANLNATTTNIDTLKVYTASSFPANDIENAEVSDTLTCSDLVAGSAVVADSEVVDVLTLNTSIEGIFTGNIRTNHLNASTTWMTSASTTHSLYVGNLIAASCDVKAEENTGRLYCGTDTTGAGGVNDWRVTSTDLIGTALVKTSLTPTSTISLFVPQDLVIQGTTTTTNALYVGSGTYNNLDFASGDLYVQDDLEVDGTIFGTVSGDLTCSDCLNATEIDDIYVLTAGDTMTGELIASTRMAMANATTTNIDTLLVYTGSTFPANDITDAEVSNTLTCSDLVAGSAVVDVSSETNLTAGDALTLTDDDIDFDGGASPGGSLGGTWASPTIDDLFLLNSADDITAFGITMGSATTSHTFYSTGYASSTGGLFTQGNGHFGGTLTVDGKATTSQSLWVGTGGTAKYTDSSQDVFAQGGIEAGGGIFASGISTTTATTTIWGMKVYKPSIESATTVLEFL